MSGFLLDTNVISELVKPKPDDRVLSWLGDTDEALLFLSVLTLGEIRQGIEKLNSGKRRSRLDSWLAVDLPGRFQDRILAIDEPVAQRWGVLSATAARKGRPVPVIDGLLAATALRYDLTLVTRDDGGVSGTGVRVLDPWQ